MRTPSDLHLNTTLPPVDCPLLIEVDGVLLRAERPRFIEDKANDMIYTLTTGETLTGRFRWTYP